MNSKEVCGVVLCGGKSTRMGSDKGLIDYQGKTLVEHALGHLKSHCRNIYISTNSCDYQRFGLPLLPDIHQNIGPIAAWHAGLQASSEAPVLFVACDMPDLKHIDLPRMLSLAQDFDIVHYALPQEPILPLPIVLHPWVLNTINALIAMKNYKLQNVVKDYAKRYPEKICALPLALEPKNINLADDLIP